MKEIIITLITSGLLLAGTIVSSVLLYKSQKTSAQNTVAEMMAEISKQSEISNVKMMGEIEKLKSETNLQLAELTRETRKHNDFASRIPTLEAGMKSIKEDVQELKSEHKSLREKYVDGYSHK